MSGKAYLVGAGIGRADLITLKGARLLQTADVVLYDRLIDKALLDYCRPSARLIYCGKEPSKHHRQQAETNALLVHYVQAGQQVVRLKGGDPCIFGRGGEEALLLAEHGLPFEIVPGISSAIAVPGFAGVPVTQKDVSAGFAIVAGYETPDKPSSTTDWDALVHLPTLIVLMGVRRFRQISGILIMKGRDGDCPAVAISNGGTDQQKVVRATLETLADEMREQGVGSPAVIVIGDVAALQLLSDEM